MLKSEFRGPYAGGPPARALEVDAPRLDAFGLAELRRFIVTAVVLCAHVTWALARWVARSAFRRRQAGVAAASEGVISAFCVLGPTFVKLGQLMASSPSVFPAPLADAALRCIREVSPFDAHTAHAIIERNLGRPPSEIFSSFEDRPLSAASVAQVHACVLPDGRQAVVKLQRPDIRTTMATDLRIMHRVVKLVERFSGFARDANVQGAIEDLHLVTFNELNFALEAQRQVSFRDGIGTFGDNAAVTAPEVFWDYCGPEVICMQRFFGVGLDDFAAVRSRGGDGELQLRRGVKVWMEACLVHGPFHGDVHAGNIWVLDDGRVGFLDFGIMGELTEDWKQLMRDLFMTSTIDDDFTRVVSSFKRVGVVPDGVFDDDEIAVQLQAVFSPMFSSGLAELSMGTLLASIIRSMGTYSDGAGTPRELLLVLKQLLYIERYARELAPTWTMFRDPYLLRNIFPEAAAARAAELDMVFPD